MGLNQGTRPARRADNFDTLQRALSHYDDALLQRDPPSAARIQRQILNMPCAYLLAWLLRHWQHTAFEPLLHVACRVALRKHHTTFASW